MAESLMDAMRARTLLCDGGMGTQLIARGLQPGEPAERWNLDRGDDVKAVHAAYRAAGCELLTTNTFQGTRSALMQHGLASQADEINRRAASLARQAPDGAWVLGDVGPFGGFLEPLGDTTAEELRDIFMQQIQALCEGGVDALVIETMSDPGESAAAIAAARAVTDRPVLATFAFQHGPAQDYRTMMGSSVAAVVKAAIDAGADAVGANCGSGLELHDYLLLAQQFVAAAGDHPVIVQPNAGNPVLREGSLIHPASPEDMATLARQLIEVGVRIVGGCCGTTPAHLQAMRQAVTTPA